MGDYWIAAKSLFDQLQLDVIVPPETTKKTIELGVKYSPEFACFPLKVTLGNFIEAAEKGADTFIIPGGIGPCRFGFYGPIHKEVLNDLGYRTNLIIVEPPAAGIFNLIRGIAPILTKLKYGQAKTAVNIFWAKLKAIDQIKKTENINRGRTAQTNDLNKLTSQTLQQIQNISSIEEINDLSRKYTETVIELSDSQKHPLKILIIGEIFLVLDEVSNQKIEKKLGNLGVEVDKSIYLSDWILENLTPGNNRQKDKKQKIEQLAKPYLKDFVGGHGRESVGETVLASSEGYDGVIHISPFTCLPEITAQGILPQIGYDKNIPIMSLSFDEQTGEAGINTRLEAFVDLITRSKWQISSKIL